jgi:hypothetical protein
MTHTPGPWEIAKGGDGVLRLYHGKEIVCQFGESSLDHDDASQFIARHLKNREANARLIAAAPALLEALRWIAVTAPQAYHAQGSQAIMDEMIHAARAAIAMAEKGN